MKKVISLLLALVMALSLLPTAVWAEGEDADTPAEEVSESFFDSSHPFTWNDVSYVWRFGWNGPDESRGEWHLYAAPEGTSADSTDGWTDCGAEAVPFAHLTEGTMAYAAACAMRSAWEDYEGDEQVPADLMWLIDMMSYETVPYTDEDAAAAQSFMDSHKIGMDGGTATLVLPDSSADDLLNAWYETTAAVRAALQKIMHCELVGTGYLYNFTQLLHRTLNAADDQGSGGDDNGNSFTNSCQALRDSGFQAPESPTFVFPAGLVENEDYTYTYNDTTGELHVVLLSQFDKGNHWADAFHNMSVDNNSLNLQIRMAAKDEYTRTKSFSFNGSPASVISESDHVDASYFNMDNGVRWSGGGVPVGTVNRIDGQATIAPTNAFDKHFIAVVWGDDSGAVLRKELVILTVEVQQEFVVNTFYDVAKPIPADKLKSGFTLTDGVTGWDVSFSDGKIELFPDNGIPTSGDAIELGRIRWDAMAPDGYHFKSYVRLNSGNGEETYSGVGVWTWPNANGRGVDELYEVTWCSDTDNNTTTLQELAVYQYDKMPYYRYISKDGVTAAPVTSLGLDTAQLSSSGIGVTYDETTGCFHVSHSEWELPDVSTLLNTRITPTPPEGAVYFSANRDDGNRDPRIMGRDDASNILASLENFEKYAVTDDRHVNERSLELVRTQVVHLPDVDVCLSGSSNHRGLTVAWWDADKNLIGISYVYGQNDDFMNRTRLPSVETAEELNDLNKLGEVNVPALVGAEGMELVCDWYPQASSSATQFFDLHLLNDQGGTKTVYIPYYCFGMTYKDNVQGKRADELPAIVVKHFDANYNLRNEIAGRYEPQGIVFETDSFSPFTVSVGNGQSDDDVEDNIVSYSLEDDGRVCIIENVDTSRHSDIPVELGVNWRSNTENVQLIGITPEAVRDMANAGRNTILYAQYGIFTQFTPAILKDIFAKLDAIPDGENDLLWIRADYRNCDAPQGSAYAFRNIIWLGEGGDNNPGYTAPTGCDLMMGLDTERVTPEGTEFVVYTPDDNGLALRSDLRVLCDKVNDGNHEMYTVFAPSGGIFVVAPKGYQIQMDWPWPGLDGNNDGYGDNIGDCTHWTDGKDWDGRTDLGYMVIKSLQNMYDDREFIELGVDWRNGDVGDMQNVGITPEVLNEMAEAGKSVILYGVWGMNMTIPAEAVSDMATKLAAMNEGKSENPALLWLKVEYLNCDGPAGDAYAFCVRAYLGETHYVLSENLNYTFQLSGQTNRHTEFKLYCPEDQSEVGTALVEQENTVSYENVKNQDDGNEWRVYEFAANHDGMFVIAPVDYSVKQNWPWYGVPTPPWTPSDKAIKPTRADKALQALYDDAAFGESGFKFPVLGEDIHFTFPDQLKEWTEGCGNDWDYRLIQEPDAGRVTIKVNLGSRERWEDAVRNSNDGALSDGVFLRYYFGNSDHRQPMTYGFDWYGGKEKNVKPTYKLENEYYFSNGIHLATLNQQTARNAVLTMSQEGEDWRIILAMSNSEGTVANAEVKYAFQLKIEATANASINIDTDNGVPAAKGRIHVTGLHSDWTAIIPTDGSVFLRTVAGKDLDSAETYDENKLGWLTVDAPEGYTLKEWTSTHEYKPGTSNPAPLQKDYFQTVKFLWIKDGAPDILEHVVVECQNTREVFFELEEDGSKVTIPQRQDILSDTKKQQLDDNGISVTYDESSGYFVAAVDAHKIKDVAQLETKLTVPAPEGAVAYTVYFFGGDTNPTNWDGEMTKAKQAMDEAEPTSIEKEGLPTIALIQLRKMTLENGITVYYAGAQMYDCRVIRWLDKDGKILEYSCIYGRNGDVSTAVDTRTVTQAPTAAVADPTLVGDGELYCDITPQTKAESQLFLLLRVSDDATIGSDGAEIYLPYSYFDLTAEEGLALAAKGVRPLIRHYLNENCTEKESLLGEYTAAGVRIVTRSFSPFLIDASGCTVGDLNGDGEVNTQDMQALYENLSTGSTTEKLPDKDDFRLLADYNGDGDVNILDYQKLYQGIKA